MNQISNGVSPPRTYRKPEDLKKINYNREAEFVFKDGSTVYGYCDGKVSGELFYIEDTVHCGTYLIRQLERWRYL